MIKKFEEKMQKSIESLEREGITLFVPEERIRMY